MSALQKETMNDAQPLLQVKNLEAFYGPVMAPVSYTHLTLPTNREV